MGRARAIPWHEWIGSVEKGEPVDGGGLDLAIVILNYNTQELLRACLGSVYAAQGAFSYTLCVVDNASQDQSSQMVAEHFPQAGLIASQENRGYSAGNNWAVRQLGFDNPSHDAAHLPRYLLLLNPDTLLPPDALARMIAFMDERPRVGVAGPRLRRPDGSLDRACRRSFPTPSVSFFRMTGLSRLFPRSRLFNAYNLEYLPEDAVHPVDAVVGAYMQVRRETIQQVGLLDEAYFMYGEDLDWAKRAKDGGWEVWYNGQVEITHVKEAASKRSRKARVAFYEAMWIFYRKHYRAGTPWLLDKAVLAGIALLGGVDVAGRIWQTIGERMARPTPSV
ncbi:MAG: glycosyltransferase family 2 protein [Chloroflexi bacterium]|nr:glycosyltransferase family 2 protein [Chloroflexota bacterium]